MLTQTLQTCTSPPLNIEEVSGILTGQGWVELRSETDFSTLFEDAFSPLWVARRSGLPKSSASWDGLIKATANFHLKDLVPNDYNSTKVFENLQDDPTYLLVRITKQGASQFELRCDLVTTPAASGEGERIERLLDASADRLAKTGISLHGAEVPDSIVVRRSDLVAVDPQLIAALGGSVTHHSVLLLTSVEGTTK
ncbi:hypothetical protein [uncultured Ruegeria sp.]|uniref:hypothetical protein n=1 Tax=uncultured Ruegeria sp. TaxID=259304 RepID=UPI002635C46F|nr:hypothetical protein [uncultured Ruegeria sp.]